ncbi:MAG: ABC transporter permease subunit, partial [Clostridiales bacterium]|nr:ABC transporter permease subunit [Clostridiales bacterium]
MDKPATKIINRPKKKSIFKDRASWELLLLCLPALVGYVMFCYVPMVSGVVLPFKNYKFAKGIFGSPWCGLKNFEVLLKSSQMGRIMRNTVFYSVWFMIIGPVFNIIFALLLFEIKNRGALKFYQTVITFPNFMSMVVVGFITYAVLAPKMGLLDQVVRAFGGTPVDVYMEPKYWPAILTIVNVWKGVGMGSMMYFASLMGIDVSLYEAAKIDGANRWQTLWRVIIPNVMPSITICVFLTLTNSFKLFDQNMALTGGLPVITTATGQVSLTEMLALNILSTFNVGKNWHGVAQ